MARYCYTLRKKRCFFRCCCSDSLHCYLAFNLLTTQSTNRDGYREFKSVCYLCACCSSIEYCTRSIRHEKIVTKHIWSEYLEQAEDIRHTPQYKALYAKRKETIERVFADAKEKHAMRYTNLRGLSPVTHWVRLKFAAMNLKKYAVYRWKRLYFSISVWLRKPIFA